MAASGARRTRANTRSKATKSSNNNNSKKSNESSRIFNDDESNNSSSNTVTTSPVQDENVPPIFKENVKDNNVIKLIENDVDSSKLTSTLTTNPTSLPSTTNLTSLASTTYLTSLPSTTNLTSLPSTTNLTSLPSTSLPSTSTPLNLASFSSHQHKAQVLAFLETQAHRQLEEISKHEQGLEDLLTRQMDIEIRKLPKNVRRMTVSEFESTYAQNQSSQQQERLERDSTIHGWRAENHDEFNGDTRRNTSRYSTRSSMRISMVPSESLTKIEMVSGSSNVSGGENLRHLELKLDVDNGNTAYHQNDHLNVVNPKYVVLEGLGLVADSDKAQVKSQLVNLRSQLDSLLSSLSQ